MKKLLVFIIMLMSLGTVHTAYAGSLNTNEVQVVNAARGRFVYQGVEYKLDQTYINQLINKLSADDVDLNEEQRDIILSSIGDYIETGVQEGYLVAVKGNGGNSDSRSPSSGNTAKDDSSTASDTDTDSDIADNSTVGSKDSTLSEIDNNSDETSTSGNGEFLGGLLTNANSSEASVIKNTGFNFNNTVLIMITLGVLMITGMLITLKYNYFAGRNEK